MIRKVIYGVLALTALYFLALGGEYSFLDLWRLERQHAREAAELEAVHAEVRSLERRADSLTTDSATLERIARERYGLIRDGERLYRFVGPDSAGQAIDSVAP